MFTNLLDDWDRQNVYVQVKGASVNKKGGHLIKGFVAY